MTSGGRPVAVEHVGAPAPGRGPAVVLVHGSDGPVARYRSVARELAEAGFHVFLPHYFDRTGHGRASGPAIARGLPAWTATVQDTVSYAAAQADVDPERIGVLGLSLGGGIALAAASRDTRVKALVTVAGFVPGTMDPAAPLPPTLILHGEKDRVVPVRTARQLQLFLAEKGTPREAKIYPDEGHAFSPAAQADAGRRIAAFLKRHLAAGDR
jgi:dienelactone hydrolase